VLGSGAFGVVHAVTLTKADERKRVAVKICESEQVMDRREFVQEADLMKKLSKPGHENVLALLGVHLQSSPLMVVLEYANAGDLKNFLNDCAPNERRVASLSPRDLVSIMLDITSGMNHLIKLHGFVHRDLAARNCLVFENVDKITVKIADFGLSRDVHYLQYYRKTGKALLPIRWMSPEAMVDGRFSSASDVWSFGVLSWEIWTFGQTPYGAHSPTEIFDLVIKGYRLSKPNCCPKAILILMSSCWNLSPAERPLFAELVEFLAKEINLVETARVQNVSMSDALDTANSQTEGNKGGQANQPAAKADNKPSGNGYSTLVLCAVGNTATSKNHTEV
jgi:serine/threonine protein kinase